MCNFRSKLRHTGLFALHKRDVNLSYSVHILELRGFKVGSSFNDTSLKLSTAGYRKSKEMEFFISLLKEGVIFYH